ncbi:MAG: class I SAM-dependent methyltransferase [bacterium]|nr:class I SAM-dependent methyltransferase [bacterium]
MSSFFEKAIDLDRVQLISQVLEIQTESFGKCDILFLSNELSRYRNGNVLDIGYGDGSFLIKIAGENPDLTFLGIEQNSEFLSMAESKLAKTNLANVHLEQNEFNSEYDKTHDVIFTRFTLQHSSKPKEFIENVYRSLKPSGKFICIEPIIEYYDSEPPGKIWQGYRERMLMTYRQWKSNPDIFKQASLWLADCGFKSVSASICINSPVTIGQLRFADVVLSTALMLHHSYPDIWEVSFLGKLEKWIVKPACHPYISIGHLTAIRT